LALSLLMLVVATVLVSALLVNTGQSSQIVHTRVRELQTRQLADASIRMTAWRLTQPVNDTMASRIFWLPEGKVLPAVELDSNDFWLHMSVTNSVSADLGRARNQELFRYAVRLLDSMPTAYQGQLKVNGPAALGGGETFLMSVKIMDALMAIPDKPWSFWTPWLNQMLQPDSQGNLQAGSYSGNTHLHRISDVMEQDTLRVRHGDLRLSLGDHGSVRSHIAGTHIMVAQGDVEIQAESVDFDTLLIGAEGSVLIKGDLHVQHLVVYSKDRIVFEGEGQYQARLFSQGDIRICGRSEFLPWSFAVTSRGTTFPTAGRGDIWFMDRSNFIGYVISATSNTTNATAPMVGPVGVYVARDARVKGLVAARGGIVNEGFIGGVAIAHKLSCAVDTLANCPSNGRFDLDSLPTGFAQIPALSLGDTLRWVAVRWRVP